MTLKNILKRRINTLCCCASLSIYYLFSVANFQNEQTSEHGFNDFEILFKLNYNKKTTIKLFECNNTFLITLIKWGTRNKKCL